MWLLENTKHTKAYVAPIMFPLDSADLKTMFKSYLD